MNETARSSPAPRTSSTDSLTAACIATSEKASWYAPNRSAARTGGSSLTHGAPPERLDPVVERADALDRPVGEPLGERPLAGVEAGRGGRKRPVGVGVLLEDALHGLECREPRRRGAHVRPRRNSS